MVKAQFKEEPITLKALSIERLPVTVQGISPLIMHKWSEKAIKMMLDKQMKKAVKGRETKNPKEDVEACIYRDSDGDVCIPTNMFKQAIVSAVRNVEGLTMTIVRGALFVIGDKDGNTKLKYSDMVSRQDMVRVGMGSADIRFRPEFRNWETSFMVDFNPQVISAEQIINLINLAGFSVGICEWRPEKNGDFGRFQVIGNK